MPWSANQATARSRNATQLAVFSSAGELAVGEAGVGVDGGVDVGVAAAALVAPPVRGAAAQLLVTAAVGDPGQLLHVDVDQLAATARLDPADHPPGRPVHPPQPVHAVADQDPMHRRGRHPDDPGQAGRTQPAGLAQRHDPPLDPGRGLMRTRPRPTRAIPEPVDALVAVAAPTTCGRTAGRCSSTPPPQRRSSRTRSADTAGAGLRA